MLDLTQSWDDIAAFLSLLAEVLRPGGDVAEVLGPVAEVLRPKGDVAEVLGPPDDDVAFLSLLAEVLGPGDDEAAFLDHREAGENYVIAVENDRAFRPDLPKHFNLVHYHAHDSTAFLTVGAGENCVLAVVSCAAFRPDLPKPFNLADYLAHENISFHSLLAEVLGPGDDEAGFSVSLRSVFCAMTLLQPTHNARIRQANTPDLSAMEMPTLLRLEKTSLSGLRKNSQKRYRRT